MNIIGPPGKITSYQGWTDAFIASQQLTSFPVGSGTWAPLPSMPIAQLFRYWWSVKSWKVDANIVYSPTPGSPTTYMASTGFIPFGTGLNGAGSIARTWCMNGNGDSTLAPNVNERLVGNIASDFAGLNQSMDGTSSTPFGAFVTLFSVALDPSLIDMAPCFVLDSSTPGNAFMGFVANGAPTVNLDTRKDFVGAGGVLSSVTGNLDGTAFDFYEQAQPTTPGHSFTLTGSFTIITSDI